MAGTLHDTVAVCPPGLEPWSLAELKALGVRAGTPTRGLVPIRATTRQLYLANRWARIATRIVVRIGRFPAVSWSDLQRGAAKLPWDDFVGPDVAPAFRVSASKSKLIHTDAVAERLHQLVGPPSQGEPEQLFVVRVHHDLVTVSVDTSGDSLHKRGWREQVGEAPLRETLAAAMLAAAGWDGTQPLLDPFCGSGTIPIEGARLGAGLPPRLDRTYAIERWPVFEPGTWASAMAAPPPIPAASTPAPILASDRDGAMVEITRANAERAGVADRVAVEERVVSHLKAHPGEGWIVTNPPYGRRVGDPDRLSRLYGRFGAVVRDRMPGYGVVLLAAERRMSRATGLPLRATAETESGGLAVQVLVAPPGSVAEAESRSASSPPPADAPVPAAVTEPVAPVEPASTATDSVVPDAPAVGSEPAGEPEAAAPNP